MVTIHTSDDILRVLAENPEWKAAVRREILTEELINLPSRFDRFVASTEQFIAETTGFIAETTGFIAEQRQFNEEQSRTNEEQSQRSSRLEESVARIDRSIDRLRRDTSNMRANYARMETTREAGVIAGDMGYKLVRVLTPDDLDAIATSADTADFDRGDLISFRRGDLVMETMDKTGATHYIAMEISYTADERDTIRAIRNAQLLTRYTGHPAHAAIASIRNVYEIQHHIDDGQVYWHPLPERDEPAE